MNNLVSLRPLSLFHSSFDTFFHEDAFAGNKDKEYLPIDVSKSDDEFLVKASLPGCKKEDLDILVHDGILTLKATINEDNEKNNFKFLRKERKFSSFTRSMRLPDAVESDKIVAALNNGVLSLTIPLAEKSKPKKINIS